MTDQDLMHTRDPLVCRSLSKSHNFLFGSSTTTCFNYANTCSLNFTSSLTLLVYESWGWPSSLDHNSRIRVSSILVLVVQVTTRFAVKDFFSYKSFHARKKKNQVPTSYLLQDSPLSFFILRVAQVKKAKDFFANELHTRAVEVREAKEAVESARAGRSPPKGDVRKKIKRPRKVVCRHKKGTWEKREKEKKR